MNKILKLALLFLPLLSLASCNSNSESGYILNYDKYELIKNDTSSLQGELTLKNYNFTLKNTGRYFIDLEKSFFTDGETNIKYYASVNDEIFNFIAPEEEKQITIKTYTSSNTSLDLKVGQIYAYKTINILNPTLKNLSFVDDKKGQYIITLKDNFYNDNDASSVVCYLSVTNNLGQKENLKGFMNEHNSINVYYPYEQQLNIAKVDSLHIAENVETKDDDNIFWINLIIAMVIIGVAALIIICVVYFRMKYLKRRNRKNIE